MSNKSNKWERECPSSHGEEWCYGWKESCGYVTSFSPVNPMGTTSCWEMPMKPPTCSCAFNTSFSRSDLFGQALSSRADSFCAEAGNCLGWSRGSAVKGAVARRHYALRGCGTLTSRGRSQEQKRDYPLLI